MVRQRLIIDGDLELMLIDWVGLLGICLLGTEKLRIELCCKEDTLPLLSLGTEHWGRLSV